MENNLDKNLKNLFRLNNVSSAKKIILNLVWLDWIIALKNTFVTFVCFD